MQQRHNHKRGFNLIEAAIVLGVVGLVIGGIWIGAAEIQKKRQITETKLGLTLLVNNLRQTFIRTRPTSEVWANTLVGRAKLAPTNWINANEYTIISPVGEMDIWVGPSSGFTAPDTEGITIGLYNMKTAQCINIVMAIGGGTTNETNISTISIASQSYITTFPTTIQTITTRCTDGSTNGIVDWVGLYFRY